MTTSIRPEIKIPIARPSLNGNEGKYLLQCIDTNWISSNGSFIDEFERQVAEFAGTEFAVATSNGTTALHLALATLGIQPGDEVIVPSLTFVATANVVRYCGATPVFVDVEPDTWCISPEAVDAAITERTKAIIPVHLYGQPCRMDELMAIARRAGIFVIEDAAEAHGATYHGQRVGGIGDIGTFSFYGNKIITTGEGGMLVTNSVETYEMARILRDHGMDPSRKYWHPYVGFNYRMTNIQGALGVAQMERVDEILKRRKAIAAEYRRQLSDISELELSPQNDWSENVCWMFSIVLKSGEFNGLSRDAVMSYLAADGIDSRPFFHPIDLMPPYESLDSLPVSHSLAANGINLPSFNDLADHEIVEVCNVLRSTGMNAAGTRTAAHLST